MKLAIPVRHPRTGMLLLCEGYELDEAVIRKLREMCVHEVWIEYPDTEQIKDYLSPFVIEQHGRVVSMIAIIFEELHEQTHADLDFNGYKQTLRDLIETLVAQPLSASYIVESGGTASNELRHACEVCVLSILLGLKLQGYLITQRKRLSPTQARNVVSLGLGAMMHDIGMRLINPAAREIHESSRAENDPEWRKHVVYGHREVTGNLPPAAAGVVLHHHQHFDGTGFPTHVDTAGKRRGQIGDEIHVFARIVCVADHFDRLRHRSDDTLEPRVRVLRRMLTSDLARRFDPVVLAALPLVVPAYPPGAIVTLNNGRRALVRQWQPSCPCQPTVQLLQSDDSLEVDSVEQPVLHDLREERSLLVAEIDGENVEQDNFRLLTAPVTLRSSSG